MFKKAFKFLWYTSVTAATLGIGGALTVYGYLSYDLPSLDQLREPQYKQPLRVYDRNGTLIADFGYERREPLDIKEFPQMLKDAVVSIEDRRFYEHMGVDPIGTARAVWILITTGKKAQGGSTITQQVARNFFLSSKKEITRKIKEIILAFRLESIKTKDEILELYMNKIFLGHRTFGFAAAANTYFGKRVEDLTLSEAATLAGTQQSPSQINPIASSERATARRKLVLDAMLRDGKITQQQYDEATAHPVVANPGKQAEFVGYVAEVVRQSMVSKYGPGVYNSGYKVYTSIDLKTQREAEQAVRTNLLTYDKQAGWRPKDVKWLIKEEDVAKQLADANASAKGNEAFNKRLMRLLKPQPVFEPIFPTAVRDIIKEKQTITTEVKDKKGKVTKQTRTVEETFAILIDKNGNFYKLPTRNASWALNGVITGRSVSRDTSKNGLIQTKKVNNLTDLFRVGDLIYISTTEKQRAQTANNIGVSQHIALQDVAFTEANLEQVPNANSGLVSLDATDGAIQALVGGFSYDLSSFNRAVQSGVQVGSTIKPFVYAAAIEDGLNRPSHNSWSWASIVDDSPVAIPLPTGKVWRPKNDGGYYHGNVTLRQGLANSLNMVVIKVARDLGINRVGEYLKRFGFKGFTVTNSLVLGSSSFTPLQMARAYAAFNNGGFLVDPYLITTVTDARDQVFLRHHPRIACNDSRDKTCLNIPVVTDGTKKFEANGISLQTSIFDTSDDQISAEEKEARIAKLNADVDSQDIVEADESKVGDAVIDISESQNADVYAPRVLDARVAWLMHTALQSNVYGRPGFYNGTGRTAQRLDTSSSAKLGIGGKTGTTNDNRSAWFAGVAGHFTTALYVAYDDNQKLGRWGKGVGGGRTALPGWIDFEEFQVKQLKQEGFDLAQYLPPPPGLTEMRINPKNGNPTSSGGYKEYFIEGTEPIYRVIEPEFVPETEDLNDL